MSLWGFDQLQSDNRTFDPHTLHECEELQDLYVAELIESDHRDAAHTLLKDWNAFVTFYRYPKEH